MAGNLYELQELSGVRLMDLELPQAFAERYPGPTFGIDGTRRLAGVTTGRSIGTIVKPSIGLTTGADCASSCASWPRPESTSSRTTS